MRAKRSLLTTLSMTAAAATLVVAVESARAQDAAERCPDGQTIASIETKTCPATSKRPALVVKRACCQKTDRKGDPKIHCKHFPHCPNNSPS